MAYGDGDGVEGMNVELAFGELDLCRQHASDLLLVGLAVAGEDDLHLRGLVFEHGYTALLEHREDGAARLSNADGAGRVAAHEELFERRLARAILGEQSPEVARDGEQASAIWPGIRDDSIRGKDGAGAGEQGKPGAGKARIDTEYQSVRGSWHLSIRSYTCAETLSRTFVGMSNSAVRTAFSPRNLPATPGRRLEGDVSETAGVNPAYLRPINRFHSYLCRDAFKDVGWDVEVRVDLLDVFVLLE